MRRDPASYLAAMIDGEGSVGRDRTVVIHNTDVGIIRVCEECLDLLGVEHRSVWRAPRQPGWKPGCVIMVTGRRNLEILLRWLPLAPTKRARLEEAVLTYKQYQRRREHIPAAEIRTLYQEGVRGHALADHLGVPTSTLYGWMDRIGLSRKPRWAHV